jgi:hypothetical protein
VRGRTVRILDALISSARRSPLTPALSPEYGGEGERRVIMHTDLGKDEKVEMRCNEST